MSTLPEVGPITQGEVFLWFVQILPPTAAAILAYYKARQAALTVQEVHIAINSRLTELLQQTAMASHAAGKVEGIAETIPLVQKETP